MTTVILFALITASPTQINQRQYTTTDSSVTVTANISTRAAATSASLYVTVDATGETGAAALTRANEKMKVVTDSLSRFGKRLVMEPAIPYKVGVVTQPGYPPMQVPNCITAYTIMRVKVTRIEDFGAVQAAALAAGATGITGQMFENPSADSVSNAVLKSTMDNLRAVAESLAASQNKRVGPLLEMSTSGNGGYSQSASINLDSRMQSYGGTPEASLNTTVTLRFRLIPRG
jgi:uncharacterized protein YggE